MDIYIRTRAEVVGAGIDEVVEAGAAVEFGKEDGGIRLRIGGFDPVKAGSETAFGCIIKICESSIDILLHCSNMAAFTHRHFPVTPFTEQETIYHTKFKAAHVEPLSSVVQTKLNALRQIPGQLIPN
ncbi:uncharacterized protein LOC131331315 [Rhododendron vialii]|uniref:uncharacterized protein LOC131331315 n=1 Tax=Rhododendron vialii TaxID=182163 RepID=UPI00265F0975|nr:uncharacterized protein LOC131331315 [Rhododendron vialii]